MAQPGQEPALQFLRPAQCRGLLVREPGLSIVLFRRNGWAKLDYEDWSARLLHDQIGFVTPTSWEGETVARFAFLHPNTTLEMVDEILDSMVDA